MVEAEKDKKIYATAIKSLESAGKILMTFLLNDKINKSFPKDENDIETEADRLSGRTIKKIILNNFPDHGILLEESDFDRPSDSEYLWVIDSIAGTINFDAKIPHFGINIALTKNDIPIYGFVYFPYTSDLFYAKIGKGAYHINKKLKINRKMKVSKINDAKDSVLLLDSGKSLEKRLWTGRIFSKLLPFFRQVDKFSNAQEAGLLGTTKVVGYVCNSAHYWDFIAHKLIIEESGGKTSDIYGNSLNKESKSVIYSNGLLHKYIVDLVKDTNN